MSLFLRLAPWLLVLLLGQISAADKAPVSVSLEIQQQLLDAQKQVLDSEKKVLAAQEALIDEKTRNNKAEHAIFIANEESLFKFTTISAIAGILFGALSTVVSMYWFIRKRVEAEIERNSKPLSEIAESGRFENRLKRESKLLVLHGEPESNNRLARILWMYDFMHVESEMCPKTVGDIDLTKYDQVIFDSLDEEHLKKFIGEGKATWYLAYKEGKPYDDLKGPQYKVAFANNEITLYPRLMELLVWKHQQKQYI